MENWKIGLIVVGVIFLLALITISVLSFFVDKSTKEKTAEEDENAKLELALAEQKRLLEEERRKKETPPSTVQTGSSVVAQPDIPVVVAPPQPIYDFHPFMDSGGNDITNITGDVPQLQDWCTARPECLGFNTNGWMKNAISSQSTWSRWTDDSLKGMYVKKL